MTRSLCALWIAAAVLVCGPGEGEQGAADAPIRVGHVASLTGDTATFGQSTDRGMRMAFEEINARGGVLGRQLELLSQDDRSVTEEARTAAQKLLQRDRVVALLGEIASSRSLAAAPEAQRARVPMISPGSTNPKVTEVGDYIFRACFIDPFQGTVMARFATEELGVKRVAILLDFKQDYSVGLADFFRKKFTELGGEIVADERYTSGDIEFRAQLTKIRGTPSVQAVLNAGFGQGPAIVTRNYRQLGITAPLYQSHGVASKEYVKLSGDAAEGVRLPAAALLVADILPDADPQKKVVVAYKTEYETKYKSDVSTFGGHAYDGLMLAVDAVRRAGGTDKAKVRDALEATRGYVGTGGVVNMSADDHMGLDLTAFQMLEVRKGNWVVIR